MADGLGARQVAVGHLDGLSWLILVLVLARELRCEALKEILLLLPRAAQHELLDVAQIASVVNDLRVLRGYFILFDGWFVPRRSFGTTKIVLKLA